MKGNERSQRGQDKGRREREEREKGEQRRVRRGAGGGTCGKQQSATQTGGSFWTVNATQTEGWSSLFHL